MRVIMVQCMRLNVFVSASVFARAETHPAPTLTPPLHHTHYHLGRKDVTAPLYLARIINAYEDLQQAGSERLCIEVGPFMLRGGL